MTGNFMTSVGNLSQELGMFFSQPPQRKKSSLCAQVIKNRKKPIGVALDPAAISIPLFDIDVVGKSLNLVVILQIDCNCVLHPDSD
jgi:hypothetical protein